MSDELFYPGAHVAERGDHVAYVMASTGETVTYRELHERANRIAHLLRSLGLKPGDHVAFCLENHPWFLSIAWGAHYAGLYYTAISSRLTADEAGYIVDDCGARVFITSAYKSELATELVPLTPGVEHRFMLDGIVEGYAPFLDAVAAQPADDLPDAVEGVDMLYSSGTTGRPKGVKVALRDVPLGVPDTLFLLVAGLFGASTDTVYLSPAPLYHAAPLRFCLQVQRAGGTVVVMEHFDAEEALRLIGEHRVTFGQFVPTMFVRMLKLPEDVRARHDVSSIRVAVHAAAPCPVTVKRQMIEWWGPVLHEYYAGTEGNGFCYTNSEDWLTHPGTVGKPLVGVLHIVGDDGEEQPIGSPGTVYFESEAEFAYHNDPEKTAGAYLKKGWSTLGDVGYVDEDGFLYLTDRKAYMIITGGVNVYPQEAENVLTMHPAVADVAVFGVPNDDFGEEVKAVVQPIEMPADDEAAAALAAELVAYCREHLADVKCPRSVDFREELPRHPTGKLYKRLLKDEYWAGREGLTG
ncbi:MAG: acyl-CoA synthetase [Microthrixaceae bacterium]